MFFIFNPQVVLHVVMLVSLRGQRVNDSLYIFTLSIKINKKTLTTQGPKILQSNLDYPDSVGLGQIVQIIESPDNRKYEY